MKKIFLLGLLIASVYKSHAAQASSFNTLERELMAIEYIIKSCTINLLNKDKLNYNLLTLAANLKSDLNLIITSLKKQQKKETCTAKYIVKQSIINKLIDEQKERILKQELIAIEHIVESCANHYLKNDTFNYNLSILAANLKSDRNSIITSLKEQQITEACTAKYIVRQLIINKLIDELK